MQELSAMWPPLLGPCGQFCFGPPRSISMHLALSHDSASCAYLQGKVQETCIFHVPHCDFLEGSQVSRDCKLVNKVILRTHRGNAIIRMLDLR